MKSSTLYAYSEFWIATATITICTSPTFNHYILQLLKRDTIKGVNPPLLAISKRFHTMASQNVKGLPRSIITTFINHLGSVYTCLGINYMSKPQATTYPPKIHKVTSTKLLTSYASNNGSHYISHMILGCTVKQLHCLSSFIRINYSIHMWK